ncbi:MAG: hypothetical protein ACI8WT_003201 [Clostridium sp.]|jgi:hypothetical protein
MEILIYHHFFLLKNLLVDLIKGLELHLEISLNCFRHIFTEIRYINNIKIMYILNINVTIPPTYIINQIALFTLVLGDDFINSMTINKSLFIE